MRWLLHLWTYLRCHLPNVVNVFRVKAENLQRKIDHEVKMRDGTAKLLAACRGSNQAIEVAKNLLVSNVRLNIFMEEMRKCKREDARFEITIVKDTYKLVS